MDLGQEQRIYFRDQFREARAAALRDAEGYQQLLFVLERFGYMLSNSSKSRGLSDYQGKVGIIAAASPLAKVVPQQWRDWHIPFATLYEAVMRARNDALHQGAFARHLTTYAVQLALILEDALMSNVKQVCDFMVRDPVYALSWQPVSFVRQQMLINSFTYLPIQLHDQEKKQWHLEKKQWHLLSDQELARYLRIGVDADQRKERLLTTVEAAINTKELTPQLAEVCYASEDIDQALLKFQRQPIKGQPLLVVQEGQQDTLIGILTAFDLL